MDELSERPIKEYPAHVSVENFQQHKDKIEADLWRLGAVHFNMILPETHTLPMVIHNDEKILGIVYGRYKQIKETGLIIGRGALVSTNRCVLIIDRKPLFVRCNEIKYDVVQAVTYTHVGLMGTVVLYTRMGDISLRTLNQTCARNFVKAIETRIFKPQPVPSDIE